MKTSPVPSASLVQTASIEPEVVTETVHQSPVGSPPVQTRSAEQQALDMLGAPMVLTPPPPPGPVIEAAQLFERAEVTNPDSPSALASKEQRPTVFEVHSYLMTWFADGVRKDKHLALALVNLAWKGIPLPSDVDLRPAVRARLVDDQGKLMPGVGLLVTSCTRPIGDYDVHFKLPRQDS